MSRRTWGITLTVLALAVVAAAAFWYVRKDTVTPPEEQKGTELVEMLPAETRPDQVSQESIREIFPPEPEEEEPISEEYEYLLRNQDGYVTVYQLPEDEIYEYTDVIMEILPARLQEEIHDGKYLRNEEELYNFLENYTS
ncbi:MAG: hypothetical protein HFI16_03330 [Lachnospiraceae bacterium]|nr:hypothetical protein [Lachnospiraceae bacterium]